MRKKSPSPDPVYRRIHDLVASATERHILRRAYEEDGAIFSGHFAQAIIHLRDLNLVRFDVTWNGERKWDRLACAIDGPLFSHAEHG